VADKYLCPHCHKHVTVTKAGRFRKHTDQSKEECTGTGEFVPANQIAIGPANGEDPNIPVEGRDFGTCSECNRKVAILPSGELAEHSADIRRPNKEARCPNKTVNVTNAAPSAAVKSADARSSSPASPSTLTLSNRPLIGALTELQQPDWPFDQPAPSQREAPKATPMNERGAEVAARLKEIFYAYTNRMARNQQTTLGPSEIGSPCDRRLAMSLLHVVPVNPGGDNWASFVGTCIHAGLADMLQWADAGTGRFATEMPLTFPSPSVPKGTGDLLDRTLCMFLDNKCLGGWSLGRLRTKGPSPTYRVQVHVYAYGARLKGESVDHVAIIGWPRESSNLEDLYVWTEPYDASVALDALKRVDRIAERLGQATSSGLELAHTFPIVNDCKFCPFYAPGDKRMERGCNGQS
jgi:hypothetical protein